MDQPGRDLPSEAKRARLAGEVKGAHLLTGEAKGVDLSGEAKRADLPGEAEGARP